jgi:hypothetical protein
MATRKTKKQSAVSSDWPKVQKGSHLSVLTYEDGTTELQWDDDALLAEVREAIDSVETNVKPVAKKATKKETKQSK